MKSFFLIFMIVAVSTAIKVAEVPFKVVGSVLSDEEEETEEEQ